jgi:hypothetical protein
VLQQRRITVRLHHTIKRNCLRGAAKRLIEVVIAQLYERLRTFLLLLASKLFGHIATLLADRLLADY